MWAVEKDPALRSDFCNLTLLDRAPDVPRLRSKLEQALVEIPRLAQRVVTPPLRIAPPEWRPDPTLDLDYHLRRVALPAPGTQRELLDLAASLCAPPFDRSRPLWEFTLVEGLEGDRAALLQKMHHTITDGVGGLKLSLSLVDLERDPTPTVHDAVRALADDEQARELHAALEDPVDRDSPLDVVRDAIDFAGKANLELVRRGTTAAIDVLTHPSAAPSRVRGALGLAVSIRRQVLLADPARSPLMADRSLGRRFDLLTIPLEAARTVARALGGSVNDVFVTGLTGGLGLYHDRMGGPADDLRMAMAISTRGAGAEVTANQFVPTRVLVPVGPKDPAARFEAVHQRITGLRDEPALRAADSLAALTAGLPTSLLVGMLRTQTRTIDFAASNLRGSPVHLYLGGARIEANFPIGPRTGCPVNFTVLSYCGELCMGINSDPAAVSDPDALVDCLRESFDALLAIDG